MPHFAALALISSPQLLQQPERHMTMTADSQENARSESTTPIPEITARITGYRQLSAEEQNLINEGKALAEQCGAWIAKLRAHPQAHPDLAHQVVAGRLVALDQRWISIGATDLQRGFMAVIRGIAQPTTF